MAGPRDHQTLLNEALSLEAEAHQLLLAGRDEEASERLRTVMDLYRRSWEAAPPRSYGRLVGMLKAAILAGSGRRAAQEARRSLDEPADSPASSYALALAALVEGDDRTALSAAEAMRSGSGAFERTAEAITALAERDGERYERAVRDIVVDFESRTDHLTGVPIADTALVLERLAAERGLAAGVRSPLLPGG